MLVESFYELAEVIAVRILVEKQRHDYQAKKTKEKILIWKWNEDCVQE